MTEQRGHERGMKGHGLAGVAAVVLVALGATACQPLVSPSRQTPAAAPASAAPKSAGPTSTGATGHPILPPANPSQNVVPRPQFSLVSGKEYTFGQQVPPCWGWAGSAFVTRPAAPACLSAEVAAVDRALSLEGASPITLPRGFSALSVEEQLLVITDLERVARGERPVLGLARVLDAVAQQGAEAGADPELSASIWPVATSWGSNWAGGDANAFDADYEWVYEDGWDGPSATTNVDCTAPEAPECWGHRDNVLMELGSPLVMGAGFAPDVGGSTSFTELFVAVPSPASAPPLYYTWAQAVAAGAVA